MDVYNRTHIVEECETYKEERDVREETKNIDECGMDKFGPLDSSEKAIDILALPSSQRHPSSSQVCLQMTLLAHSNADRGGV